MFSFFLPLNSHFCQTSSSIVVLNYMRLRTYMEVLSIQYYSYISIYSTRYSVLSHPLQPARRREERRQRPQRHTTVVTAAIDQSVALVASIKKGESTGGLNRTLHPHLTSNNQTTNNNRLWNSSVKIETDPADHSEYTYSIIFNHEQQHY